MSNDISVIRWKDKDCRPEEGSYVLLKCIDESDQVVCEPAAYENGMFLYFYDKDTWGEVNEELVLGWAYYPYDERGEGHRRE